MPIFFFVNLILAV